MIPETDESTIKSAFSKYTLLKTGMNYLWERVNLTGIEFCNVRALLRIDRPETFTVTIEKSPPGRYTLLRRTKAASDYKGNGDLLIDIKQYNDGNFMPIEYEPKITITANMKDGRKIKVFDSFIK